MEETIAITRDSAVCFGRVQNLLPRLVGSRRTIAVSDDNVARAHAALVDTLEHVVIPAGEQSKTLATAAQLYRAFLERDIDRDSLALGIGGGVVTDLAGFVASTYMRGIAFGFVPTTLLGMVDASIGGKNGVDFDGYKNIVGTFSQPHFVVCDTELLATLPDREFRAGLAEIIKSAIIADADLFTALERTTFEQLRTDTALLDSIVAAAIRVKAQVVAADERESGLRRCLNLGHTLAHAIEKVAPHINHGEAVAIGLHHTAEAALHHGLLDAPSAKRIFALLERYGFHTALPAPISALAEAMTHDKKRSGDSLRLILPTAIGSVRDCRMTLDETRKLFEEI